MRILILATMCMAQMAYAKDLETYLQKADGKVATVYGFSEKLCGDVGKPRRCSKGAITASGQMFDPHEPTAAMALPFKFKLPAEGLRVGLMFEGGTCTSILINDKKHPRFINHKPLDLSIGAVKAMGGIPTKIFSAEVFLCDVEPAVEPDLEPVMIETITEETVILPAIYLTEV
jgi:hypothetical protein